MGVVTDIFLKKRKFKLSTLKREMNEGIFECTILRGGGGEGQRAVREKGCVLFYDRREGGKDAGKCINWGLGDDKS